MEGRLVRTCDEGELYISFRREDGSWTDAVDMGETVNAASSRFSGISPDGRYFFFSKLREGKEVLYWVDATIIDDLRPDCLE